MGLPRWLMGVFGILFLGLGTSGILTKYIPKGSKSPAVYGNQAIAAGVMICIVGFFFIYWAIKKPKEK